MNLVPVLTNFNYKLFTLTFKFRKRQTPNFLRKKKNGNYTFVKTIQLLCPLFCAKNYTKYLKSRCTSEQGGNFQRIKLPKI